MNQTNVENRVSGQTDSLVVRDVGIIVKNSKMGFLSVDLGRGRVISPHQAGDVRSTLRQCRGCLSSRS